VLGLVEPPLTLTLTFDITALYLSDAVVLWYMRFRHGANLPIARARLEVRVFVCGKSTHIPVYPVSQPATLHNVVS
jgi:hypothetical protein